MNLVLETHWSGGEGNPASHVIGFYTMSQIITPPNIHKLLSRFHREMKSKYLKQIIHATKISRDITHL